MTFQSTRDHQQLSEANVRIKLGYLGVVVALSASACMLEVGEPGIDGVYEDEVAVSTSELSNVVTLAFITADTLHGLGQAFALFRTDGEEPCIEPDELTLLRYDGTVEYGDTCRIISSFASESTAAMFIADNSLDEIARLDQSETRLAGTSGNTRGRIQMDATHVYWTDNRGLHKVRRTGGGNTELLIERDLTLLGLNGSTLFFAKAVGNAHTLRRISINGGAFADMITYNSATGFRDFAVDGTATYWVDNTQATNRVRRLSRALGAGMTTVISDADDTYSLPTPTSNGLHFVQVSPDGVGSVKIRRWLNNVFTDQHQTSVTISAMRAAGTSLIWTEDWPTHTRVRRGTI